MSRRSTSPLVLREFQQEAVDRIAAALIDTATKIRAAPTRRTEITRQNGCFLLEAPTASGKTVMLAVAAERAAAEQPIVWFWWAPFKGVVDQTAAALRTAAPGLRVRDPRTDRTLLGTREGDVFVATWASVATRNAESRRMRTDDDLQPALDSLAAAIREAGFLIGAVVDEAHHSFKPNTEAFRFLQQVLRPDLLMLATATPADRDIEVVRRALEIVRFQRIAIARPRVVIARLNKEAVKAVTFVARGTSINLLDLNEVALGKAVAQHRALKQALRDAGIPLTPLLLVQAATAHWTPERVKSVLLGQLGFLETAVGVHTADEPDPNVQALAQDPNVEVLVFKMAVATGFDAPRAFTLCALRPVVDAGFGLQVIGRIMRVHPLLQTRTDLPAELNTGYVFLGNADSQSGLQSAADRIKAIRDAMEICTDNITIYTADGEGALSLADRRGQHVLVLEAPVPAPSPDVTPDADPESDRAAPLDRIPDTLFDRWADTGVPQLRPPVPLAMSLPQTGQHDAPAVPYRYPQRTGLLVPKRLKTEKMPANIAVPVDALVSHVTFTAEHRAMVRQVKAEVERRESSLFDTDSTRRVQEHAAISDMFTQQSAFRALRVSDHIDPQDLARRLLYRLKAAFEEAGEDIPEQGQLRRGLNVILVRTPRLCRDAMLRAMASCTEVVDAADLPVAFESPYPLPESKLNLYGCVPPMNTWETRFADWLDRQDGRVLWWLRNPSQPRMANAWAVRIMLPENGAGFFPDFVICVEGRKKPDGIALADTKERIEGEDAMVKSRTEHREYGRALILTYDLVDDKFTRVDFDAGLGRNREVAPLRFEDLLRTN
jgi:type III restriction enzyme